MILGDTTTAADYPGHQSGRSLCDGRWPFSNDRPFCILPGVRLQFDIAGQRTFSRMDDTDP